MTPKRIAVVLIVLGGLLVMSLGATLMAWQHRSKISQADAGPSAGGIEAREIEEPIDASGLPHLFDAPQFKLTNQDNSPLSNTDLAGRPYVAAFIFTHCTTACPMMTGRMAALQDRISEKSVRLISFTVDPVRDTPAVLKEYGKKFSADPDRWQFLTGSKDDMEAAEKGFNLRLPRPDPTATIGDPADPMSVMPHSDRFLLVDAKGRVRGIYDSKDDTAMDRLKVESERLARLGK